MIVRIRTFFGLRCKDIECDRVAITASGWAFLYRGGGAPVASVSAKKIIRISTTFKFRTLKIRRDVWNGEYKSAPEYRTELLQYESGMIYERLVRAEHGMTERHSTPYAAPYFSDPHTITEVPLSEAMRATRPKTKKAKSARIAASVRIKRKLKAKPYYRRRIVIQEESDGGF